jgi:predicted RNA binding protein YcfA (HicA-like mRNA interferase family)
MLLSFPLPLNVLQEVPNGDNIHRMKIRAVLRLIEEDGWYLARTRGSHRQFKHPYKKGLVTIAGKPGDELAPGTLNSVLKQAGLKK